MSTKQIQNRLYEIFAEMGVNPHSLTDQAHLSKDLGLDSLDITDLMVQTEFNFGIQITDQDHEKLQTYGQFKEYLFNQLQAGTAQQ